MKAKNLLWPGMFSSYCITSWKSHANTVNKTFVLDRVWSNQWIHALVHTSLMKALDSQAEKIKITGHGHQYLLQHHWYAAAAWRKKVQQTANFAINHIKRSKGIEPNIKYVIRRSWKNQNGDLGKHAEIIYQSFKVFRWQRQQRHAKRNVNQNKLY